MGKQKFRVKIEPKNERLRRDYPQLTVLTEPLRVVATGLPKAKDQVLPGIGPWPLEGVEEPMEPRRHRGGMSAFRGLITWLDSPDAPAALRPNGSVWKAERRAAEEELREAMATENPETIREAIATHAYRLRFVGEGSGEGSMLHRARMLRDQLVAAKEPELTAEGAAKRAAKLAVRVSRKRSPGMTCSRSAARAPWTSAPPAHWHRAAEP